MISIPSPENGSAVLKAFLPPEMMIKAAYTPSLEAKDIPVSALCSQLDKNQVFLTPILVRMIEGKYEVVYGWHLIEVFKLWQKDNEESLVCVYICEYSDKEALRIGLRVFSEGYNVHRMNFAIALNKAKKKFDKGEMELAEWLGDGYSRAAVNNLLRLSKLTLKAQSYYVNGIFKHSVAKYLCAKTPAEQNDILSSFVGFPHINWSDVCPQEKAVVKSSSENNGLNKKSMDLMRLERDIGEKIGAPISVECGDEAYSINIKFFSKDELENIVEQLFVKKTQNVNLKGEAKIAFGSIKELNNFIDPLFSEDF
jgi:hypothetical protein